MSVQAAAELTRFQKEQILRLRRHYYQQAGHIAAQRRRLAPWFQVLADHAVLFQYMILLWDCLSVGSMICTGLLGH